MTISIEWARALHRGQTLYCSTIVDKRGLPRRARVNGAVQFWKTRPGSYRIPMKIGLRDYFSITEHEVVWWVTQEEAIAARMDRILEA